MPFHCPQKPPWLALPLLGSHAPSKSHTALHRRQNPSSSPCDEQVTSWSVRLRYISELMQILGLILQAFPRRTSGCRSSTHTWEEDAKGFSSSALAESDNPFWGLAVEMPVWGEYIRSALCALCLKSVFVAIIYYAFSANPHSCYFSSKHCSSFNFSFWKNTKQKHYFKSLKEASHKSLSPSLVHLASFYNTSLPIPPKHWTSQCFALRVWWDQRTVDDTPRALLWRSNVRLFSGCSFSIPVSKPFHSSDFCHPYSMSKLLKSCCRISDATFVPWSPGVSIHWCPVIGPEYSRAH